MRRAAVLVALLLVAVPVLGASTAPAPTDAAADRSTTSAPVVDPARNTSEFLALPAGTVAVERVGTATLDVGGTVAADAGAIHGAYGLAAITTAYDRADSAEARRAALRTAADDVAARVDAVVDRAERARERYVAGESSTRTYLRELAVISATARRLDGQVGALSELDQATEGSPLADGRLATMRSRLLSRYGPVRALVRDAMTGEVGPTRVSVAAGEEGLVVAAVASDSGQYLREAVVHTAHDPAAPDGDDQPSARIIPRVRELYPWAYDADPALSINQILPDAGVYRVQLPYGHGTLEAYLDGGTDEVYYEVQRKDLATLPTHGPQQTTENGVVLAVNRTQPGGPLAVRLRDPLTGDAVDAPVSVGGASVGRTGPDGTLWTVTPPSQFEVTARVDGENVSLSLTPSP